MAHENKNSREIGLGDLIIALNELPWQNEEHERAIFNALGFNWQNSPPATLNPKRPNIITGNKFYRKMPIADKKPELPAFTEPPAPELPVELPQTILTSSLKPLTPQPDMENGDLPDWLTDETDDSDFLTAECHSVKPARASLFPALTQRGILGAALMVRKPGKNIDISVLIAELVKGRIPQKMPFYSDTTLERGCQLLLDYSDSMTPFWEDLSALIDQIENLIGKERVNIYEFDQNPNLSKRWISSKKSELWRYERGRPILVASNLGITGQPRRLSIGPAWRTFIDACRKNNLPLLILVPWSKEYWPSGLGPHPLLIPWSPRTTAAMVYRLVGKGHKVDL